MGKPNLEDLICDLFFYANLLEAAVLRVTNLLILCLMF